MKLAKERGGFGAGGTKFLWCMAQISALSSEEGRTPLLAAPTTGCGPGLAPLVAFAHILLPLFNTNGLENSPWKGTWGCWSMASWI